MPSPNGYFDFGADTNHNRNWWRQTLTHDIGNPPWLPGQAGDYEFQVNIGTAPGGPFTPAVVTSPGSGCNPSGNPFPPGGASTLFGVGGPAELDAGTDYWLEVVLTGPGGGEVDRYVSPEPVRTEAYPTFSCNPGDVTETTGNMLLGATAGRVNLSPPCNRDTVVWEIATAPGGPYTAEPSQPVASFSPSHEFTGLTADTDYYVRARFSEQAQTGGEYLVTQECSFTTAAAPVPPDPPSGFQPLPCASGDGGAGADVEGTLVCDVDAEGNVIGVALVEAVYDETGARTGTRLVSVTDGTPYVAQGTMQPCREGCCPEPVVLCDVQDDGSAVQFLRTYTGQADGGVLATDHLLDGSVYVPTGTVGSCDTYSQCIPSPNIALDADCGPGEPVTQQVLLDSEPNPLANSVFNDDATADPLCGGQWDRPADTPGAPFPVNETFRNTTFDQPGPVLQGTAPYPDLTADVDGAGAGWLQVADINSGTNGLWQVPAAFPTSQGMNAGITFASHDGTTPGGDGMAFVFTDGSIPAQSIPVGGFGNLGLQNWQGGYVAVVLDEYGQTCSCSQANPGDIDASAGPCGFCANTISLQLAGAARQGASCGCCTIASLPLAPKALNQTTRTTPARLLVSIIEEGGQTFVSASVDWNDGNGPVQYFDRENVTGCAGPPPPTLRMAAYGGSGGAFRAVKEMRDAIARPAGVSNWRAFPVVTDTIPDCASLVTVTGDVDVTFTADDQTTGNNNPEAYFWLVNTATGAVLNRAAVSSLPAQVGQVRHLSVTADVPPADVPNLRLYVGAESRDENGSYSTLWENLTVGATATGCPAEPVRTVAISAPCPIPVTIVGGAGDGEGGGTTVFNAPSTFEDAPVCMVVAGETFPGFRREVRAADGAIDVTFLGLDGLPQTPDSWQPGGCVQRDTEIVELCDLQPSGIAIPYLRVFTYDENGEVTSVENQDADGAPYNPTGQTTICSLMAITQEVLCDQGAGGAPFLRSYVRAGGILASVQDQELDGQTPYVVVGPVGNCGSTDADRDREVVCWTQASTGAQVHTGTIRHDDALPAPGWILFDQHQVPVSPAEPGLTFVPCGGETRDSETVRLCDAGGTEFLRTFVRDGAGTILATVDTDLDGAPYAPVAPVGACGGCCPVVVGEGCWETTVPAATGRWTSLRLDDGAILLVDQEDGHTVDPGDVVACPDGDPPVTLTSQARLLTNAAPWTPGDVTGTLTGLSFTVLTGTATLVDQDGTVSAGLPAGVTLDWQAEDANTLDPPQSMTPAAGGSTLSVWTQR